MAYFADMAPQVSRGVQPARDFCPCCDEVVGSPEADGTCPICAARLEVQAPSPDSQPALATPSDPTTDPTTDPTAGGDLLAAQLEFLGQSIDPAMPRQDRDAIDAPALEAALAQSLQVGTC